MRGALSSSWKRRIIREKLFMKQGGFCYYCLEPVIMSTPDESHPRRGTLDHIKPLRAGGTNSPDNLVLACFTCNQRKGSQREAAFRKKEMSYGR